MEVMHDIWTLLDIIHKATAAGPQHNWIVNKALAMLDAYKAANEGPKAIPSTPDAGAPDEK